MGREGYIKLYRKLIDSPVFENEKLLKIWIWCLCRANHTDTEAIVGLQKIILKKGQFAYGLLKASAELGIPKSTLDRNLRALETFEMIKIKTGNKFSVITVENWGKYQDFHEESGKQTGNKQETSGKQMGTDKNEKNDKEIYSDVPAELSEAFMEWVKMRTKIKKPITTKQTVTRALNKLNALADTTEEKIAILNQSTDNCWQGLFELKEKPRKEEKRYDFKPSGN